jgi:hypothetical protein
MQRGAPHPCPFPPAPCLPTAPLLSAENSLVIEDVEQQQARSKIFHSPSFSALQQESDSTLAPLRSDPQPDQRDPGHHASKQHSSHLDGPQDQGTVKALVFGVINGLVAIPALIAFATIVFQDPIYSPYLGQLCRFFFFSSCMHQMAFILMSSLPFAVGE